MNAECKILSCGIGIIKKLRKVYKKHFRHIVPSEIIVINVYNVGRQKYLGKIRNIPPQFALLLDDKYVDKVYIIEINKDAIFDKASGDRKQYKRLRNIVIFHELFHISPKKKGQLRGHTVHDFTEVLQSVGLSAWTKTKNFPNVMKRRT